MISNKLPSKFFNFISIEKRTVEFKKQNWLFAQWEAEGVSCVVGWQLQKYFEVHVSKTNHLLIATWMVRFLCVSLCKLILGEKNKK
jgi:hypothetical protein